MVRGEVEWKCVEVGEVEIFLDEVEKIFWWKKMEEWRRLEILVERKRKEGKRKKEKK